MVKGIVFDFNGVIVDDYPLQKEAWNQLSQEIRGKGVTDLEMLNNIRGVPTRNTVLWMSHSLNEERVNELVKEKADRVKMLYSQSPLFCLNKGLEEFLDEIKRNAIPCTIASSSTLEDIQFSFERLRLGKWFDIDNVIYNDGSYKGKPAPDAYLRAATRIDLSPNECVVFEDAVSGVQSAYIAGSKYIIAVGSDDRLQKLIKLNGVIKGIHNFTEINLQLLMNLK